jgi:hypothetical protein
MSTSVINLVIIVLLGIAYMFTYSIVISKFLNKISSPKNMAILMIYFSALLSAGVNLYHISEISTNAFTFFFDKQDFVNAVLYSIGFFVGMWVFSFAFFWISFFLVGMFTSQVEKHELSMNNREIAGLHGIILITLSFVIAPVLISIASQFIPYPELPF